MDQLFFGLKYKGNCCPLNGIFPYGITSKIPDRVSVNLNGPFCKFPKLKGIV